MFNVKDCTWALSSFAKKNSRENAGSQVEHDSTVSFCFKGGRYRFEKSKSTQKANKMWNHCSALVSVGQNLPAEALLALGIAFQKWYRSIWEPPEHWKWSERGSGSFICRQSKAGGQLSLLRNQENQTSFPGTSTSQARKGQGQFCDAGGAG